jgi:hypothetical protein
MSRLSPGSAGKGARMQESARKGFRCAGNCQDLWIACHAA